MYPSFLAGPRQRSPERGGIYSRLFDKLSMGESELDPQQKESAIRRGLLGVGLGMLQTKGQGFGGALGAGLETGVATVDRSVRDFENQRYKREIMGRTRQGMERNAAIEQAQAKVLGADGNLDQQAWGDLFRLDPEIALKVRDGFESQRRKSPGAPVYLPNEDGTQELPYFWDERAEGYVPADNLVSDGFLGQAATPAPEQGFLGDAVKSVAPGFNGIIGGLLGREGGYVADDAGAGPTNYGINSRANPDIDVANLTPEKATEIYKTRYWDAIGGDSLPPQIQEAAFDAAVNQGPERAKQWLAAAGNDPRKFAELRQQHYDSLSSSNPAQFGQHAEGWRKRNMETAGLGGQSQSPSMPSRPRVGARPITQRQRSELEQKVALARELGASDAEIRALVLGTAATGSDREKPAPGYRWSADGQSQERIPGGPADKSKEAAGDGLNDRQKVAVQGVQRNLLSYASALTGVSQEELSSKTPAQIEELVKKNGDRFVQGGIARYMGAMPGGQLAVDSANSDITSYSQGAGAAWASYENPTGIITNADRETATLQMPNSRDPVEVQARKIRNFLELSGFNAGSGTSQSTAPGKAPRRFKYDPNSGKVE